MKASEFCEYFDFTLTKNEDGWYIATDNQGVFDNRYCIVITDLAECFDILLENYIDDDLEYDGFNPEDRTNYYEKAEQWLKEKGETNTTFYEVIRVLNNPQLLEDDVSERGD